uniref:Uncharacterized protein n=1 Tax=Marseillevirus LCMAC202 TaxID=2506606 RepID=A0A481YXZ5_9VIRU|nr:MAG: hypothetical protein LCMAC202_00630 [Marseillevirus LCMAC202]
MPHQFRKDPFHVNRDVVRDNLFVVRKLRLPRGAQIRAQQQFATAVNNSMASPPPAAMVPMPYTGTLCLTVLGTNDVIINNPFVKLTTPVVVNSPIGAGTASVTSPGQITLTGIIAPAVYKIVVGVATDARNNGFGQ